MQRPAIAQRCCTTPSAMGFWFAMFLVFYGAGFALRTMWLVLAPFVDTHVLVAMAAACAVNFARHRTLHCAITGPMFVLAALVAALDEARIWKVDIVALWVVVLAGACVAFAIERRTCPREGGRSTAASP